MIIALLFLALAFVFLLLVRNEWVLRARLKYLNTHGAALFLQLPPYDQMLYRFWIWDIHKFEPKQGGGHHDAHTLIRKTFA